jgi:hypothetical protein
VTGTATYARFALLELQVRALLREAAGASSQALEKVSRGLSYPHYIEKIVVYGLFDDDKIGAELRLEIDWRQHTLAVKAGVGEIQVPNAWAYSVAPSLQEAVRTFNEAVDIAALTIEWAVTYAPHFDRYEVNRILGFSPAPIRQWERDPDQETFGFGPLTEASLVVALAVDW